MFCFYKQIFFSSDLNLLSLIYMQLKIRFASSIYDLIYWVYTNDQGHKKFTWKTIFDEFLHYQNKINEKWSIYV